MSGRGKAILEELKRRQAIKDAEKAAAEKSPTGNEELMKSVHEQRARAAVRPALLEREEWRYQEAIQKAQGSTTQVRTLGRGSMLMPRTSTTAATTTSAILGSPRPQSGAQSVASGSSTYASTGAIPKGSWLGLQKPAAHQTSGQVPGVGALRVATSSPNASIGPLSVISQSPMHSRSLEPSPISTRQTSSVKQGDYTEEEIASINEEPMLYHLHEPYGSHGKAVEIVSNFIRLEYQPGRGIFEYVVEFEPILDSRNERHRLIRQLANVIGKVQTFDGNKLHLPFQLPDEITERTATSTITGEPIQVRLRFLGSKQIGDQDRIYHCNILFRKMMSTALNFVQINRDYFDPMQATPIPRHNLEVWPGFVTAVNEHDGGVFLQLDVSHRILRKDTAYDVLTSIRKRSGANFQADAKKALIGSIVLTRYNNKSYRVDELDFDQKPQDTFTLADGTEISFIDYFKEKYKITLKDPNQPMIVSRPKAKTNHEKETTRLTILVPEVCHLTGLTDAMKADFTIRRDIAVHTCVSPADRYKSIQQFLTRIQECPKAMEILNDWGLNLAMAPEPVQGRILKPLTLFFGGNIQERVNPNTADFSRTAMSKPMLKPIALTNWILVYLVKNVFVVKAFFNTLQQEGRRLGMNVAKPVRVKLDNDRTETYLKNIRANINKGETQLVVVVVPAHRSDLYSGVKKLCCVELPVASQVVEIKTISNQQKLTSVAQKILLQINCKLGGELWSTKCDLPDVMTIGVDVNHDVTSSSTGQKSIAGFVASTSMGMSRWYSTSEVQGHKQELVDGLQACFIRALTAYYDENQTYPKTIVLFRDGVGDGQLETVIKHECIHLKQSFKQIKDGDRPYEPAFAYIVVMKRINVRLFSRVGGSMSNPAPGTIVDRVITRGRKQREFSYDFLMLPQKVGQGTVTPTRFVVVHDHPTLTPEILQKFAYDMTHMYYNWPGTIRVPAPCQYANKLANLVGENLHQPPSEDLSRTLFYL